MHNDSHQSRNAGQAEDASTAESSTAVSLVEILVEAARSFADTVQREGTRELGEAIAVQADVRRALVLEKIDDVRSAVLEVVDAWNEHIGATLDEANDEQGSLRVIADDFESAGEMIYELIGTLDPTASRDADFAS
ncbi:hypothetical protein GCM10022247_34790 [Allokutzneria multivorans]|uniref:Uncharacterized protein n=1 Tax=Allokutzneria multivorans TaxID=1142134 RepID=A0ABP7SC94_9PSEU